MILGKFWAIVAINFAMTWTTAVTICGRLSTIPLTRFSKRFIPDSTIVGRFSRINDAKVVMISPAVVMRDGRFSKIPFARFVMISTPSLKRPGNACVIPSRIP